MGIELKQQRQETAAREFPEGVSQCYGAAARMGCSRVSTELSQPRHWKWQQDDSSNPSMETCQHRDRQDDSNYRCSHCHGQAISVPHMSHLVSYDCCKFAMAEHGLEGGGDPYNGMARASSNGVGIGKR